ncbi:MAG: gamma-glutamyl-gamma-aminobutyrate hydrolase family protein [Hyphomicrobiaceae bacterium]|nr:gamma-glutamyl-gamma-aminobutyrate hydrolase family protein [Hyphomicrobiaceae bacterium]
MATPIVGVISNSHLLEGCTKVQFTVEHNLNAIINFCEALPLIVPSNLSKNDINTVIDAVDGILLTGSRANVHPTHYGVTPDPAYEPYDENRDTVALALALACIERQVPIFGICRGLQEINVAFGGTLHPEVSDLPGRLNHRAPRLDNGKMHPDPKVIFGDRHDVILTPGGLFTKIVNKRKIRVNSLHCQAINKLGNRIIVEGIAEDGTIEAISIAGSSALSIGIQWHAEYNPQINPINSSLFKAFGRSIEERFRKKNNL